MFYVLLISSRIHISSLPPQSTGKVVLFRVSSSSLSAYFFSVLQKLSPLPLDCTGERDHLIFYDGSSTNDPVLAKFCGGDWLPKVVSR